MAAWFVAEAYDKLTAELPGAKERLLRIFCSRNKSKIVSSTVWRTPELLSCFYPAFGIASVMTE